MFVFIESEEILPKIFLEGFTVTTNILSETEESFTLHRLSYGGSSFPSGHRQEADQQVIIN